MNLRGTILLCLLLAMLIFTACGQSEAPLTDAEPLVSDEPTVAAIAEATAPTQPQEIVEESESTEEVEENEEPTPIPTPEATSENCLACHGDKEQLIETASPEPEETESSESSGVG